MAKLITPEKLAQLQTYVNQYTPFDCRVYVESGKCPPYRLVHIADKVEITTKGVRFSFTLFHRLHNSERNKRLRWLEEVVSDAIASVLN